MVPCLSSLAPVVLMFLRPAASHTAQAGSEEDLELSWRPGTGQEVRVGWSGSLPVDYSSYSVRAPWDWGLAPRQFFRVCPDHTKTTSWERGAQGPGLTRAFSASALTISGEKPAPGRASTPPLRAQSVPSKPAAAGTHCPPYGLGVSIIFKTPYYIHQGHKAGKSEGLVFEARLAALGARIRPELQSQPLRRRGGLG